MINSFDAELVGWFVWLVGLFQNRGRLFICGGKVPLACHLPS
jgi:hypothetical protein